MSFFRMAVVGHHTGDHVPEGVPPVPPALGPGARGLFTALHFKRNGLCRSMQVMVLPDLVMHCSVS